MPRRLRPSHPLPAVRLDASQGRPLVLLMRAYVEHVRYWGSLPIMPSPMDFNPAPQVWRLVAAFGVVCAVVIVSPDEAQNEASDRSHASEVSFQPANQARACDGSPAAGICIVGNERPEDGEAPTHASGRWTYRKPVLASSGAWNEGWICPQHRA